MLVYGIRLVMHGITWTIVRSFLCKYGLRFLNICSIFW